MFHGARARVENSMFVLLLFLFDQPKWNIHCGNVYAPDLLQFGFYPQEQSKILPSFVIVYDCKRVFVYLCVPFVSLFPAGYWKRYKKQKNTPV